MYKRDLICDKKRPLWNRYYLHNYKLAHNLFQILRQVYIWILDYRRNCPLNRLWRQNFPVLRIKQTKNSSLFNWIVNINKVLVCTGLINFKCLTNKNYCSPWIKENKQWPCIALKANVLSHILILVYLDIIELALKRKWFVQIASRVTRSIWKNVFLNMDYKIMTHMHQYK